MEPYPPVVGDVRQPFLQQLDALIHSVCLQRQYDSSEIYRGQGIEDRGRLRGPIDDTSRYIFYPIKYFSPKYRLAFKPEHVCQELIVPQRYIWDDVVLSEYTDGAKSNRILLAQRTIGVGYESCLLSNRSISYSRRSSKRAASIKAE